MRCRSGALSLAAALCLASAHSATADWHYARWGMSPAEVVAASGDVARRNADRALDAEGLNATLVAPFEEISLTFRAVFLFDDRDRLSVVTLSPVGATDCSGVRDALVSRYGPPQKSDDMVHASTTRWDDLSNDNLVVFLRLEDGGCSIQYSNLPNTRPNGRSL